MDKNSKHSKLIDELGGLTALASKLGYSVQRVANWKTRGIPPREMLNRPDVFKINESPQQPS